MQPVPSPLSTPPPPPLRSHWQRVALPIQFFILILMITLLGSVVHCEQKRPTTVAGKESGGQSETTSVGESATEGAGESGGRD